VPKVFLSVVHRRFRQETASHQFGAGPQKTVWLSTGLAFDDAAFRIGRLTRNAGKPQRTAINDVCIEKPHQYDRVFSSGRIDIVTGGQPPVGKLILVPPLSDDPFSWRRDFGPLPDLFHHLFLMAYK